HGFARRTRGVHSNSRHGAALRKGYAMHIRRFPAAMLATIMLSAAILGAADKNSYRVTILVSNEAGEAPVIDPKLVNAWGIAASDTSPWWVAEHGNGNSPIFTDGGAKDEHVV